MVTVEEAKQKLLNCIVESSAANAKELAIAYDSLTHAEMVDKESRAIEQIFEHLAKIEGQINGHEMAIKAIAKKMGV